MVRRRPFGMVAVLLIASACQAGPSPAPVSPPPATASPAPSAMEASDQPALPSPIVLYEVTKNAEGGHGGPPALDLDGPIAVEYSFEGTCSVTIAVTPEASGAPFSELTTKVAGPAQSGLWRLTVPSGRYYVSPDEAVGCTFHILVRTDP